MIRIVEMSVRFGIMSLVFRHKKRARHLRVPWAGAGARPRASGVLDQIRSDGNAGPGATSGGYDHRSRRRSQSLYQWGASPMVRRATLETAMATGTVKWFNPTKGYGFIQPSGGGRDVFVHISAVERAGLNTLNEGQTVEYEIESNRGKESAVNLKTR